MRDHDCRPSAKTKESAPPSGEGWERHELREAVQALLDIGKRDLTNPKYDGYFESLREALNALPVAAQGREDAQGLDVLDVALKYVSMLWSLGEYGPSVGTALREDGQLKRLLKLAEERKSLVGGSPARSVEGRRGGNE